MGNELFQLAAASVSGATVQTVNAHDLHAFLEIRRDFSTWVKDRIDTYGFAESVDYVTADDLSSPISGSTKSRVQRTVEYHLTRDMAKELAMVERNEKGRQARLYFIACERRAKESPPDPLAALSDPAALRTLLLAHAEREMELAGQVAALAPKAEALDRIAMATGSMCITDAAKTLQVQPKAVFNYLRTRGWIYTRKGGGDVAYQDKLTSGLLEYKATRLEHDNRPDKIVTLVRVTPKGLAKLADDLRQPAPQPNLLTYAAENPARRPNPGPGSPG